MCGVRAAQQLVLIFVASRQKHATRGRELILFLTPGIDQTEQGELLRPQIETSKMTDLNEDDILKLIKLQTVLLLFRAFSSRFNTATSTPAAKQHQMIVFIGRLAGGNHYDDLPSHLESLPYIWNSER